MYGSSGSFAEDLQWFGLGKGVRLALGAVLLGALFGHPALATDLDNDGIWDGWEIGYGMDNTNAADAASDVDEDGTTAYQEYRLDSNPVDPASRGYTDLYRNSFERTAPLRGWWKPESEAYGWSLTTITASDGETSLESANIGNGESASISVALLTHESVVRMRYYRNAGDGDHFRILLNGTQVFTTVDGETRNWKWTPPIALPAGYNELELRYEKDGSGSDYCDCVRIDQVEVDTLDSDFDEMPDVYESGYAFLNPQNRDDAHEDADADGLENVEEWRNGTDPSDNDSDNDSLPDGWEVRKGLDPLDAADAGLDSDGDGWINTLELTRGTHPLKTDTDGDGLSDVDEYDTYGTDPAFHDTDEDLLGDGWEIAAGFDPLGTDEGNLDTDGDGFINEIEYRFATDPIDALSYPWPAGPDEYSFEDGVMPNNFWERYTWGQVWEVSDESATDGTFALRGGRDNLSYLASHYLYWNFLTLEPMELTYDFRVTTSASSGWSFSVYDQNQAETLESFAYNNDGKWRSSRSHLLEPGYQWLRFSWNPEDRDVTDNVMVDNIRLRPYDADNDGLPRRWEIAHGLDPNDASDRSGDPDYDNLPNHREFDLGTHPWRYDTDLDGLSDTQEVTTTGTDPALRDTDRDQMTDGWELANGFDPLSDADREEDADADGWENYLEQLLGSDPNDAASVPQRTFIYSEDFESAQLSSAWSVEPSPGVSGNRQHFEWDVVPADAPHGRRSLRSNSLGDDPAGSELLYARFTAYTPETLLEFDYFVPEELDGVLRVYTSAGTMLYGAPETRGRWETASRVLEEGVNRVTFRVQYTRDAGDAGVLIDNIRLTPLDNDQDGILDEWEAEYGLSRFDAGDAAGDLDGDGLSNLAEFESGADPTVTDSDGDGISDGDEGNVYGTDPTQTDTDGDLMPDDWEIANGLDPLDPADANADPDLDGIQNYGEFRLGLDPNDPASTSAFTSALFESFEGGVLPAGWETDPIGNRGWEIETVTASDGVYSLRTAPGIARGDRAAIRFPVVSYESELQFRIYRNAGAGNQFRLYVNGTEVWETTNDQPNGWVWSPVIQLDAGLNDIRFEYWRINSSSYGCNCVRIDEITLTTLDSDGDFIPDTYETANGLNPADPSDALLDPDGDGLNNRDEYRNNSNADVADTDGDGISDGDEVLVHLSDPTDTDTDDDFLPDAWEIANGYDPTDPADATQDTDLDGFDDLFEYRMGSDISDAASVPALCRNPRREL